ncbi:MAG: methyl-accepting chemotaxis protein [Elusimicrobia bacterium]|nr:methyl-accepting chemotaxis protein [Elusimicrobiota bacterium]
MKKRLQFFAKPRIQIKYVLVTIILVLITAFLSIYVMDQRITHSTFAENLSRGEISALIHEVRIGIWYVLGIVLIMALFQATIFFHQLVGPVVALERIVDRMADGYFGGSVKLRRHDELKDFARKLELLGNKISEEVNISKRKAREISDKIKNLEEKIPEGDFAEIKQKLDNLLVFFKDKE